MNLFHSFKSYIFKRFVTEKNSYQDLSIVGDRRLQNMANCGIIKFRWANFR